MRKTVLFLLVLALCMTAGAALAQTFSLDSIYATIALSTDTYTVITPETIDWNADFLSEHGLEAEALKARFAAEGVLLQAWDDANSRCLEITAVKDENAETIFDINEQTDNTRMLFRTSHTKGTAVYCEPGYSYSSANWRRTSHAARFLKLQYTFKQNGETVHRGYQRRTIRNGYTITLDMKVLGRSVKRADETALDNALDNFNFTQILPMPKFDTKLTFSSPPPEETNSPSFTVKGTASPNSELTAVLMGLASTEATVLTATANNKGAFTMAVTLPAEGVYLMTLTAESSETLPVETSFLTEYQKNILPVSFTDAVPAALTGDKLTIAGKTLSGVSVQLDVNGKNQTKKTGNGTSFSFTVDTSAEGEYTIVLVFTKQGLSERRFSYTVTREYTQEERRAKIKEQAIKPAYKNLVAKLKGYDGRIMVYSGYITEINEAGGEWAVFFAFDKKKAGYQNFIVVTCQEEPPYQVDERVRMYGTLAGEYYTYPEGESAKTYPCFELLFWETIN